MKGRINRSRVTYADINRYLMKHFGFAALNSWIADVKEMYGIQTRYRGHKRTRPCPEDKRVPLRKALCALKLLASVRPGHLDR